RGDARRCGGRFGHHHAARQHGRSGRTRSACGHDRGRPPRGFRDHRKPRRAPTYHPGRTRDRPGGRTVTEPLICSDLVVTFADGPRRRTVLDRLDLTVATGEIVVISGDSGSGKSTLLTVAGLLRKPDHGEVRLVGTP